MNFLVAIKLSHTINESDGCCKSRCKSVSYEMMEIQMKSEKIFERECKKNVSCAESVKFSRFESQV